MLTQLTIQNLVLIEQCDLAFASGLCVLTGETGAGKSILLDALGLALGARAEARLVRQGKEQAMVSAVFAIPNHTNAQALLETLGLESADEVMLRRSVMQDGKSKCFINDVPVSVQALKTLGDALVEIHGQHDGRGLLDAATHRTLLDEYGMLQPLRDATRDAYERWQDAQTAREAAEAAIAKAETDREYLQHLCDELAALAPEAGEEEKLAEARRLSMQSEKQSQLLQDTLAELAAGKGAANMLYSAQRMLTRSSPELQPQMEPILAALDRALTDAREAEESIASLLQRMGNDPHTLERMEERLFALRAAARKYHTNCDGLADLLKQTQDTLSAHTRHQQDLKQLKQNETQAREAYFQKASDLFLKRQKTSQKLEKTVSVELTSLKMATTRFCVQCEQLPPDRASALGCDKVQFLAATHAGATLAPLQKIASGGELSRFMLAMKVALARVQSSPTLVFDEIDTGTGGAVADAIGKRLLQLGKTHQVLVVTHLPQVAAQGTQHLRITKQTRAGKTYTQVQALSAAERKEELARMLAGAEVTQEARQAAQKLLQAAP